MPGPASGGASRRQPHSGTDKAAPLRIGCFRPDATALPLSLPSPSPLSPLAPLAVIAASVGLWRACGPRRECNLYMHACVGGCGGVCDIYIYIYEYHVYLYCIIFIHPSIHTHRNTHTRPELAGEGLAATGTPDRRVR